MDTIRQYLPPLGYRIKKTVVAVALCLVIYMVRGYRGMPLQSVIAAVICMLPQVSETRQSAYNRVLGTIIGAAWGLLFLLIFERIAPFFGGAMPIYTAMHEKPATAFSAFYCVLILLIAVGTGIALYTMVLIRQPDSASLAAVVFVCVVVPYPDIEAPLVQTANRIIDTLVGTLVAIGVNSFTLPRDKDDHTLFFLRTADLVPDRIGAIPSRVLVMLNRFFDDGARISLISEHGPAFFMSQMGSTKVNTPLIMMDGAALYDKAEQRYLEVIAIPHRDADIMFHLFRDMGLSFTVHTIHGNSYFIYREGERNEAEQALYEIMKRSPYRHYAEGLYYEEDQVVFFKFSDTEERIRRLEAKLGPHMERYHLRLVVRPQAGFPGVFSLYIYDESATIDNMKKALLARMKDDEPLNVVELHREKGPWNERKAVDLLVRLKNIYEPVCLPFMKKRNSQRHTNEN
ncbi:MAG: FUSC family protein [Lachnospiraceae bacterium]|nr:FUSC family protein [Lachnospiraceae bacterium]